jgi:hypothetical protein
VQFHQPSRTHPEYYSTLWCSELQLRQSVAILHHDDDYLYLHDGVTASSRVVLAGDLQLLEGMRIDPRAPAGGLADRSATETTL